MTLRYVLSKGYFCQIAERLARECSETSEAFAIKEIERQIRKCDFEIDRHFDLFVQADNDEFRKRMNDKAKELEVAKKTLITELARLKNNEKKRMTDEELLLFFISVLEGAEASDDFVAFIIKEFVKVVYVADDGELIIYYDIDGDDGDPNKGKKSNKIPKETRDEHKEKAEPLSPANSTDTEPIKSVRISSAMVRRTRLELVRLPTRPSNVRVCQFRHPRKEVIRGL